MDIDIDFYDRNEALEKLKHIKGSRLTDDKELVPHVSAVYFQNIPVDPFTGLAAFPYNLKEQENYFKIDFLNIKSVYDGIKNEEHIEKLLNEEPEWSMLQDRDIVQNLFQLGNERTFEILKKHPPKNIDQLAMVMSLIRPPMYHFIGKSWDYIEKNIWNITEEQKNKGAYRKSHAYSYALALVLQMNKIREEALKN